jgi:hypothetical protein
MWKDITKEDPKGEVLAIGYQDEMLIGYCTEGDQGGWTCESDNKILHDVTHWIDLKDLIKLRNNAEWEKFFFGWAHRKKNKK